MNILPPDVHKVPTNQEKERVPGSLALQVSVRKIKLIVKYCNKYYVLFGVFEQNIKSLLRDDNYLRIFRGGILGNKNDFLRNLG